MSGVTRPEYIALHLWFGTIRTVTTRRMVGNGGGALCRTEPHPVTVTLTPLAVGAPCGGSGMARTFMPNMNGVCTCTMAMSLARETLL